MNREWQPVAVRVSVPQRTTVGKECSGVENSTLPGSTGDGLIAEATADRREV